MATKRCNKCGETKPVTAFHKNASKYDGLASYCAACKNAAKRARKATPEGRAKSLEQQRRARRRKGVKPRVLLTDEQRRDRDRRNRKQARQARRSVERQAPYDGWTPTEIFEAAEYRCFYCGTDVKAYEDIDGHYASNMAQADHFTPLASGGTSLRRNMVCSCASCNNAKSDKDPYEFILENIQDS